MNQRSFLWSKIITFFAAFFLWNCPLSAESYDFRAEFEAFMDRDDRHCEKVLHAYHEKVLREYPERPSSRWDYWYKIDKDDLPKFFTMLHRLADKMGIDMPECVRLSFDMGDEIHRPDEACIMLIKTTMLKFEKYLVVGKWLICNASDEEIAAVMAHELAHLKFQHPEKQYIMQLCCVPIAVCVGLAVRTFASRKDQVLAFPGAFVCYLGMRYLSECFMVRRQEKEADLEAVKILEQGDSAISYLSRCDENRDSQPSWWRRIFASHPSNQERIKYIQEAIAESSQSVTQDYK